jgi:23S rRNA (uridine2552-2'-O)-methyltransferase
MKIVNFFLRARSAFKLIEMDDKIKILKPGQTIIECGAAPGAWTQVIVQRINSDGKSNILN